MQCMNANLNFLPEIKIIIGTNIPLLSTTNEPPKPSFISLAIDITITYFRE